MMRMIIIINIIKIDKMIFLCVNVLVMVNYRCRIHTKTKEGIKMKTVKMVQELVKKALRGDREYKVSSYTAEVIAENTLVLRHYGTTILRYNLNTELIECWGGYSASDRDALNNALYVLNHPKNEGFRINKGALELV
jgi:hypothetical protein